MLLGQKIQDALGSETRTPYGSHNYVIQPVTSFGNYPINAILFTYEPRKSLLRYVIT